jgi:hypothetical protein
MSPVGTSCSRLDQHTACKLDLITTRPKPHNLWPYLTMNAECRRPQLITAPEPVTVRGAVIGMGSVSSCCSASFTVARLEATALAIAF